MLISPLLENTAAHRLLGSLAPALLPGFQLIQPPNKQQVGELLQHLQRVGDAAAPEGIPDPIDLVAQLAGEHRGRRGAGGDGGAGRGRGGAVAAAAAAGAGGWGPSAWRWIYPRRLQPSARALHTLGGTQGHHLALELLQVLIADGLSCLVLQGCADLVVRDPAAVLRDQGDQVVDEVGEVGHRSGLEALGWGSGKQSLGLGQDQGLDGLTMTGQVLNGSVVVRTTRSGTVGEHPVSWLGPCLGSSTARQQQMQCDLHTHAGVAMHQPHSFLIGTLRGLADSYRPNRPGGLSLHLTPAEAAMEAESTPSASPDDIRRAATRSHPPQSARTLGAGCAFI